MFGAKPTGFATSFGSTAANTSFGTPAFGQSTPAASGGLFGQTSATGTATGGGLFGGGGTAFGAQQQQNTGFNFGATPAAGGGLFGAKTTASSLFGTPTPASSSSAFGFGANTAGAGGFGTATTSSGGLFGAGASTTGGGLFGTSGGFGQQQQQQQQQSGTTVKFNPVIGQDTVVKNGVSTNVNTKHQCITAMKEYEAKSLEELRMEDYAANRKGKQVGTSFGFGTAAAAPGATSTQQSTGFSFGAQQPAAAGFGGATAGFGATPTAGGTSLFGQTSTQQSGGLFGAAAANKPLFGSAATTTAASGFGFGTNTSTGATSLFGQQQAAKPLFGAATTQASMFGAATNTFGQQPAAAASSGFGGFGTAASGGLFANKTQPFGTQTTASTSGFNFAAPASTGSNLFAKPFSQPSTGFGGFGNTATTSTGFGTTTGFNKPGFGLATTSAAPSFNFGQGLSTGNTSLFGNNLAKPTGFGTLGTTGGTAFGGGFGTSGLSLGGAAPAVGGSVAPVAHDSAAQLHQTLLTLTHSPYGDSPLFWNMGGGPGSEAASKSKREEVLRPTNPAAQKAVLASQHKVSPRPIAKIKPKALHGSLNGSKSHIFEGLEDDDFSFGNDTFQPRRSVKKLSIRKPGLDSGTPSRASSCSGEPANMSSLRDEEQFMARSPDIRQRPDDVVLERVPDTENIIRSKGIPDQITDTPNRGPNMDDTIAMLNARNRNLQPPVEPPVPVAPVSPITAGQQDPVNISIISRGDDSNAADDVLDERPLTPPPPHPAGVRLARPGYYTIPRLEDLTELLDEDSGDCLVEDFTIGREGYGSIFFPGVTNVANMNFDEIVFFRRKEVIVYPDDDNKPPEGEGLNKKAEITLDCVWPRDKSIGTPIKSPEKLRAMRWQDKIEENSLKVGAKFIDYRPETGSWVFEVKHFSKYGLVDDSDEDDPSEQEKKRLRTAQQQQVAVQKKKVHQERLEKQQQVGLIGQTNGHKAIGTIGTDKNSRDMELKENLQKQKVHQEQLEKQRAQAGLNGQMNGHTARFTIGTDEDSEGSGGAVSREAGGQQRRQEVPMGDDDVLLMGEEGGPQQALYVDMEEGEYREYEMEMVQEEPSSHRLAASMGVDARNMQVMKASFFGDDEAPRPSFGQMFSKSAGRGDAGSPLLRQADKTGPSLFSSALKSKYMSPMKPNLPQGDVSRERMFSPRLITPEPLRATPQTFQPPVKEYLLLASGMTSQDAPRKVAGTRVTRELPRVQDSYAHGKQGMMVDAGLFMGRSFRVGWGPNWTLAHSGEIIQALPQEQEKPSGPFNIFTGSQQIKPAGLGSEWNVHMQKLNVADHITPQDKTIIRNHREMLEIRLVHSRGGKEGGCPVFTPAMGVDALHQYAERNQDELDTLGSHPDEATVKHMGMVWDLCVALWGNMPEFKDIDVAGDSYLYQSARREAFSKWLSAVSGDVIRKEVQQNKFKDQGHHEAIFAWLTGRQVSEACRAAQDGGDHRLAMLLAQALGNYMPRQMVSKQLEEWIELGVSNFISPTVLKIYSLLSGQLVLTSPNLNVNTCQGLDWKRSLALHLWYSCRLDSPIQEAMELFERAYSGSQEYDSYISPPLPPYLETDDSTTVGVYGGCDEEDGGGREVQDACYHLLRLYCLRCHNLEQVLNPVTSTRNQLDYRLSWHLSQVLQSLSYQHLSPYHRACLHMNFAAHLEALGLWEWAVFVALHLENPVRRQTAVVDLLGRHVQLSQEDSYLEKEELLREKLMVPAEWLHQAKALRASYENRPREEAWHLLKAQQWNRSHQVLLKHIAADALIHEEHEYLRDHLVELSIPAHCAAVLDWQTGGRVFLDYINICHTVKQLSKSGTVDQYELERLLPEVKSLCTKVGSIPCRNSKDRLCQSEMAKKAANFLRLILTLQCEARGESQPPVRLLAPYISNIPMPEDYSLQELRALTRSYIREQTVS